MSEATDILDAISTLIADLRDTRAQYTNRLNALEGQVTALMHKQAKVVADEATAKANKAVSAPVPPQPAPGSSTGLLAQRVVKPGPANPSDMRTRRNASPRQLDYIERLCDEKFARVEPSVSNMLEASQVIGELQSLSNVPQASRDLSTTVDKSPAQEQEPEPEPVEDKIDMNVLRMIPDGRYAVTADDGKQTVFLKLATRTARVASNPASYRDLRYKSSDSWLEFQRFYPTGHVTGRNSVHGSTAADLLVQVMMDKGGCADRYGERFQECVNCGRELTDDKSRYYRLGSDCIQHRLDVVEYIDATRGEYTPGAASQD